MLWPRGTFELAALMRCLLASNPGILAMCFLFQNLMRCRVKHLIFVL